MPSCKDLWLVVPCVCVYFVVCTLITVVCYCVLLLIGLLSSRYVFIDVGQHFVNVQVSHHLLCDYIYIYTCSLMLFR